MQQITEQQRIAHYIYKLLSEPQIEILKNNNVPWGSPNGLRRYLAEQSFEAFIKCYFADEFTLEFAPFQYDVIRDCQDIIDRLRNEEHGVKLARCYPRAHGKSSFYARLLPLYCFLFNLSPLTVLIGNTYDSAKRLLRNIKDACEHNELLIEDFDIKGSQWGLERLENNNGAAIQCFGIDTGSIRGISNPQRPRLVICDDLDDDQAVRSAAILASNKDTFDKSILQLGDSVGFTTSFVVCGTLIRKTSLLQYIMDSPEFHSRIASAVLSFSASPLWEQWRSTILELARENRQPRDANEDSFYQEHKAELLHGTQMLWDRPDAYRHAMLVKLSNERAFYSELQNTPRDRDGTSLGTIQVTQLPANINEWHLLGALDSTVKGGKDNDLSAWVELLYHPQTRQMIIYYVDAKQRNYAQTINDVAQRILSNPLRYRALLVEENSAGHIIASEIQQRLYSTMYQITPIYNTVKKEVRIDILSQYISIQQLSLYSDDPELRRELEDWPYSRRDDVLDALANVVLFLRDKGLLQIITLPSEEDMIRGAFSGLPRIDR